MFSCCSILLFVSCKNLVQNNIKRGKWCLSKKPCGRSKNTTMSTLKFAVYCQKRQILSKTAIFIFADSAIHRKKLSFLRILVKKNKNCRFCLKFLTGLGNALSLTVLSLVFSREFKAETTILALFDKYCQKRQFFPMNCWISKNENCRFWQFLPFLAINIEF